MNKRKMNLVLGILFIVFFLGYIMYALARRHNLEQNHRIGVAIPYDCSSNGRGNGGGLDIEFRVTIDKKEYRGTMALTTRELSEYDCRNYFIGRSFPVAYLPSNPSNAILLIRPKDFSRFGTSFPDSLSWVLKYLRQ